MAAGQEKPHPAAFVTVDEHGSVVAAVDQGGALADIAATEPRLLSEPLHSPPLFRVAA
jgi:hypothetical protein